VTTSEEQPHDTATATDRAGQLTAGNKSIGVNGISLVCRRFGDDRTNAPPLVLLQRFRGNLDSGDPALVDRLALDREVIPARQPRRRRCNGPPLGHGSPRIPHPA
jgi:hypothetical protein